MRIVEWIGLLHPLVVHFPIALLLAAALAEVLVICEWVPGAGMKTAVRFCLWTGTLAALVAAALGWADAILRSRDFMGFLSEVLAWHRWLGTSTAGCAVLTLGAYELARLRGRGRGWYRLGLLLCVLLIVATGYLGASLIYGWDYLRWPPRAT